MPSHLDTFVGTADTVSSVPRLYSEGQITDEGLRVLAALEYMYYSMKPCVRRVNTLWNRRSYWDTTRRLEAIRAGTMSLPMDDQARILSNNLRDEYTAFQADYPAAGSAWARNFYGECDAILRALPSTAFNWALFFGSFVPREVRNASTDHIDLNDLSHVGDALTYMDLGAQSRE